MDTPKLPKLSPPVIGGVIVGGVALGLLLRRMRPAETIMPQLTNSNGQVLLPLVDVTSEASPVAGNLSASNGGSFGQSFMSSDTASVGRDNGSIELPVTSWIVEGGNGVKYVSDGQTVTPLATYVPPTLVQEQTYTPPVIPTPVVPVTVTVPPAPAVRETYGTPVTGGAKSAQVQPGQSYKEMVAIAYYVTPSDIGDDMGRFVANANDLPYAFGTVAPFAPGQTIIFPPLFG